MAAGDSVPISASPWMPLFNPEARYGRRRRAVFETTSPPPIPSTISEAILSLSPLGYWKLDETSGSTATDSSGNGHHGTYGSAATLANVAGPDGANYASFTSFGVPVQVPHSTDFQLTTAPGLTVFVLYNGFATSGSRYYVQKFAGSGFDEWRFIRGSSLRGRITSNLAGNMSQASASEVATTPWRAHAWTVPTTPSPGMTTYLYENSGIPLAATITGSSGTSPRLGTGELRIGGTGTNNEGATGALAHVAIFPPLTDSDVSLLMTVADNEGWF